jgi:hypothetical protein
MNSRALEKLLLAFAYCKNELGSSDSVVPLYTQPVKCKFLFALKTQAGTMSGGKT